MKKNILFMVFGALIATIITIGVYALNASSIEYNDTTVESALDDLYTTQSNTVSDLENEIETKSTTIEEQAAIIEGLNDRLDDKNEVKFGSFNANQAKSWTITTGFRPSKVIIILPSSTEGYYINISYDASIGNSVYDCWTNNMGVNGTNNNSNDGCGIYNSLLTVNDTGFVYTTVDTNQGTTYWYAIK